MTAREVGNDVVFAYFGSINTGGFPSGSTYSLVRGIVYPVNALVEFGPAAWVNNTIVSYAVVATNPDVIGTGGTPTIASFHTGSHFGIGLNNIELPVGYTSGSPISGTMTFTGKTLAGMGVNATSTPYAWTLTDGQKVTLTFLSKQAGPDNAKKIKALQKKAKALKKKIAKAKKNQQSALVKKLKKQLKRVNAQIRKLRKK